MINSRLQPKSLMILDDDEDDFDYVIWENAMF